MPLAILLTYTSVLTKTTTTTSWVLGGSLTAACHNFCMMNSADLMCPEEFFQACCDGASVSGWLLSLSEGSLHPSLCHCHATSALIHSSSTGYRLNPYGRRSFAIAAPRSGTVFLITFETRTSMLTHSDSQ